MTRIPNMCIRLLSKNSWLCTYFAGKALWKGINEHFAILVLLSGLNNITPLNIPSVQRKQLWKTEQLLFAATRMQMLKHMPRNTQKPFQIVCHRNWRLKQAWTIWYSNRAGSLQLEKLGSYGYAFKRVFYDAQQESRKFLLFLIHKEVYFVTDAYVESICLIKN